MNQINSFRYEVQQGEAVTFVVTPIKESPDNITAEVAPGVMARGADGSGNPTFSFSVTAPVGNIHFAKLEGVFSPDDPDDAEFDITVSGSNGGGPFDIPAIERHSPVKDPTFRFEVTK